MTTPSLPDPTRGAATRPEFTICVPVWNGARFIEGILASALAQSYPHWRLIVGDNASTDGLSALLASYGDSRISHHRWDRHVGPNENFNRTMALADAEWVLPIGADDRLDPDALERMALAARAAEVADRPVAMLIAACRRVFLDGSSAEAAYYGSTAPVRVSVGRYDSQQWLAVAATGGPYPWNIGSLAFWRPALMESGAFRPDIGLAADMELIFRLSTVGDVVYLGAPLMDFAVHPESDGNIQWARNRRNPDADVPLARALLAALQAHEGTRTVREGERFAIRRAAARGYLQRAAQHRVLNGGLGRRAALRDVTRALRLSVATLIEPRSLALLVGAVAAPASLLRWASAALQRRHHAT